MPVGKPLKILLILETSGGGSGRHVIDLARELIKAGCAVTVVYSGLRAAAEFLREIKTVEDLTLVRVDMRRSPCPGDVIAIARLRKEIVKHGPFDVIHGHSSKGGALARIAALGLPGIRVYTPHAFRTLDPSLGTAAYRLYSIIERLLARISTGIVLVSAAEKQHALQLGLPASTLHVVPNGMVAQTQGSRGAVRQRVGINSDVICIGFVGRLVPQKAPERLIKAYALIAHQYPDTRLVMLGDGPLQPELYQLAGQLDINRQISWLEGENGAEFMPALDVFVMPSLYEAFPYVLIEAANAGLPIIATPVGGTDEMLADQENGFVVGHDNTEALADALERLIKDAQLRSRMGAASRTTGLKFSAVAMAEKTLTLYRELIGACHTH